MEMVILYWVLLQEEIKDQAFLSARPPQAPRPRLTTQPLLLAGLLARLDARLPMLLARAQDGVAVGCRERKACLGTRLSAANLS